MCRVLAADNFTNGVKSMNTSALIDYVESSDNWEEVSTPSSGDVILWQGHTALVVDYNATTKQVTVVHATRYKNSDGEMVESVVEEKYSMKYYNKKGASFYRPINDMPDGDLNSPNNTSTSSDGKSGFNGSGGLAQFNPKKYGDMMKSMPWNSVSTEVNSDLKNSVKFAPPELGDANEVPPELMQ